MSTGAFSMLDHSLVLLPACAGFACLALAMERHQTSLWGKELSKAATRALRMAGWALLLLCLWLAVARMGWSLGLVAYGGHASIAAALVFIGLLVTSRAREIQQGKARAKGNGVLPTGPNASNERPAA